MFTRKLSTTLFIALAILVATSTVVEATHDLPFQQRNHVNRMIRKRSPQDPPPLVPIGAAPIPGVTTSTTSESSTTASTTSSASETTTASTTSSTSSGTETGTETSSSTSSGTETSTSSGTSTTESTSSTTSTTATPPPVQTTPPPVEPIVQTLTDKVKSTKTVVTSVEAEATAPAPQLTGAAKVGSNVVTILIAIVASIGGILIIWTIFRKWKLGSSKRFEDRMNPIDWRPEGKDDDVLTPRRMSGSSLQRGPSGRSLTPLPDHDFTAGPSNASPVGGYADMSRGSSPTMRENRGYDFGVPSHSNGGRY